MDAVSLFPHDKVRPEQHEFIKDVHDAISRKKCLIAHAPTGLGKTAASLAPALEYAMKNQLTVFFLTSRNTQHAIAIDTLRKIKLKYSAQFSVTDIVGKKHMCAQEGVDALFSRQFHDYCKALRENGTCFFFSNFRKEGNVSQSGMLLAGEMKKHPMHTEQTVELGKKYKVCPYEAATLVAKESSVIVADYYYVFNPHVRESFLKKTGKNLQDSIIIIDEGHNLPGRLREMLSETITLSSVERAIKEADKFDSQVKKFLADFRNALLKLSEGIDQKVIKKEDFLKLLKGYDLDVMMEKLDNVAGSIREIQKQSFVGSVSDFLKVWCDGDEEGYARILSRKSTHHVVVSLSYYCLDPGLKARQIIEQAHSVILMSGTLTPTGMYKDILGFPKDAIEKEYKNPFPPENKLSLIVTSATTKFALRDSRQYQKLGEICSSGINAIPGNVAVFFSSYDMMDEIYKYIYGKVDKAVFKESPNISKSEKSELLSKFKAASERGGLLLAVIGGNFNEGIDLPGDFLNGVLIVGLPLQRPDLETKELIGYYDKKYFRGWDYGYVFPAFTKALQSAGRCIRTETDRGVVLFIDERYAEKKYISCFPKDSGVKPVVAFQQQVKAFFSK